MDVAQISVLCLAAAMGGAVNSVAGGGTLLTFPSLALALGTNPLAAVLANGTSTVALFPGSVASIWGYRREVAGMWPLIRPLLVPSVIGAALGTTLVTHRDPKEFATLVPWLILTAATLFLLQPVISKLTGIGQPHEKPSLGSRLGIAVFQFVIAVYGGYFGAGIGILMLSALAFMGISDIHRMNGVKTVLASVINGTSVLFFIKDGKVDWSLAVPMLLASIVGGYLGAAVARRLDKNLVRYGVVTIGLVLSAYYFWKNYSA